MDVKPESGWPADVVYDESKLTDSHPAQELGSPGEYPFDRDLYPRSRVDQPWTTGTESSQRDHELAGDAPIARGEAVRIAIAELTKPRESGDTATAGKTTDVMKKGRAWATPGEICHALRAVWGVYKTELNMEAGHGHRLEPLARPDARSGVGTAAYR